MATWTDEGLLKMLSLRSAWEEDFEKVTGKGSSRKPTEPIDNGDGSPQNQAGLWELFTRELKRMYPELVFAVDSATQKHPVDFTSTQCSNKFYNLHACLFRSTAPKILLEDREIPEYLFSSKILFHLLGHTRSNGLPDPRTGIVTYMKSRFAPKTMAKYVQKHHGVDTETTQQLTREQIKRVLVDYFTLRQAMLKKAPQVKEDTMNAWLEVIEQQDVTLDGVTNPPFPDYQRKKTPERGAYSSGSASSKLNGRQKRKRTAQQVNFSEVHQLDEPFTSDSENDDIEHLIVEKQAPNMSSVATIKPVSAKMRSFGSYPPLSGEQHHKYLIFDKYPLSTIVVKGIKMPNKRPRQEQGYTVKPEWRLADVLLHVIKTDNTFTEEQRGTLILAHTILSMPKYRPILTAAAFLASPDGQFMDIPQFIDVISKRFKQFNVTFETISRQLNSSS